MSGGIAEAYNVRMTDVQLAPPSADELVGRLFNATVSALELLSVYLGWRLGLYRTIAAEAAASPRRSSRRSAAIDARYAREWLEQQAAAGFLVVDDVAAAPDARRYSVPEEHHGVLVDPESLAHVVPFAAMVVGIADALPDVVDAYRSGAGVPLTATGPTFATAKARSTGPLSTTSSDRGSPPSPMSTRDCETPARGSSTSGAARDGPPSRSPAPIRMPT